MPHIPDSRHADHDPLAIAAHAAGDATGTELETARDLLAGCADCAALHADLRAISAALPTVPAPVRPRDFRLTQEQAASLRPAGWRRLLAPLAGPRFAFAGPLGGGLATLGIAGILVAGSLGAPIAGSAPAAGGAVQPLAMEAASPVASEVAAQAASPAPSMAAGAPRETTTDDGETAPMASPNEAVEIEDPYAVPGDRTVTGVDTSGGQGYGVAGAPAASIPGSATGVTAGVPDEPATSLVVEASPVPTATIAVVGLALLAAGLLLAGLRLLARRTV